MRQHFRAFLLSAPILLTLAALGWGSNAIAARLAIGEVSPMLLVSIRWAMVCVLVLTLRPRTIIATIYQNRQHWRWLVLMGAGLSSFNILLYSAAHSTSAINLGLIQSTIPALIIGVGLVVLRTPVGALQLLGLVLAMAGAVVVITKGALSALINLSFNHGDLLMLAGCFCYAGYALGLARRPPVDSITMLGVLAIFAFLTSLPFALGEVASGTALFPSIKGWLILLYIALFPSFLSQVFFIMGIDRIGSNKAGMFTNLVPVFAALLAIVILGEMVGMYHLLSLLLVFTGITIAQKR